jgi:hypothetical protein
MGLDELRVEWLTSGRARVSLGSKPEIYGEGWSLTQALEELHLKLKDPRNGRLSTSQALYYVERLQKGSRDE